MNGTGRRPFVNPMIAGAVAGTVIALIVGLMALINLQYGAPWAASHTVTAQVSDPDAMSIGSDVRIAGRVVGQVVSIDAAGDHSNVVFHVDEADWPLPADTTASIRLATLLGQKYLQLNPGHSSAHLADGAVMSLGATKPVVDFDQVLDTFDKPTRQGLTSLIRTVGSAVKGEAGTLQNLIPDLSDLSVNSQVPTQELATRDTEFNAIIANLGTTAAQLSASSNDLAGVIDNLNSITATLASNQGKALTQFITSTDQLNLTTDLVLGNGSAAKFNTGLKEISPLVTDLNTIVATILPQTASLTQPVAGAEPSDFVNGNNAIPAKSAIDLIYEITSATSQGYGSTNFGIGSVPDFQGNFWLRQNGIGFDPCSIETPPCYDDQSGAPIAGTRTSTTPVPSPTPSASPSPSPSASPAPSGRPTPSPSPTASPSPSASPKPTPSPSPSPGFGFGPNNGTSDSTLADLNFWDFWTGWDVWNAMSALRIR